MIARRFWLGWMIASAVGAGVGVILWTGLGTSLEALGVSPDSPLPAAVAGTAFGTSLGVGQWLALRRRLRGAGGWIVATGLGFTTVFVIGSTAFPQEASVEFSPSQQVLLGAALGAAVALPPAILQWLLVLRTQLARAGLWFVISVASWAIGFAISFGMRLAFGELTFVAGPVVSFALTGLAMLRLLAADKPSPPTTMTG